MQARLAEEAARQRQSQAEEIINQRVGPAMDLYGHALELVRTNRGFVDVVLRLPSDDHSFLRTLAREVDGKTIDSPCWCMDSMSNAEY